MLTVNEIKPHDFAIDDASHTIHLMREFDATRAQVFAAWTIPDQLACWWDASGEKLTECEMDLQPGGRFKFVTRHHPEKPFAGLYREITPPGSLVFDANGAVGRVTIVDANGKTRMTVEITCQSAEHLAQFAKFGVAEGTSRTLDNLVAYLR